LGGQLPLYLDDDITDERLDFVVTENNKSQGPCNGLEHASMMISLNEFNIICKLLSDCKK